MNETPDFGKINVREIKLAEVQPYIEKTHSPSTIEHYQEVLFKCVHEQYEQLDARTYNASKRATGITTRLIDATIQMIFFGEVIFSKDLFGSIPEKEDFLNKIDRRVNLEHFDRVRVKIKEERDTISISAFVRFPIRRR